MQKFPNAEARNYCEHTTGSREEVKLNAVELLDKFGLISAFKVYSEKGKKVNFGQPSIPKIPGFVLQEKADNRSSQWSQFGLLALRNATEYRY